MASKRTKFAIIGIVLVILLGGVSLYYKKYTDRKESVICVRSYINVILEMYQAKILLDSCVKNEKSRQENKHIIERHLEEARSSLNVLIAHSGEASARLSKLKKAIDDWERFSNAVMIAFSEISKKGMANDTGEIQAFSKLSMENFIGSMFIAFSTFSNMEPDPPIKSKEKLKVELGQKDREYFSDRLKDAYNDLCKQEKKEKRLNGIEWAIIGTKNFLDNPNISSEDFFDCK